MWEQMDFDTGNNISYYADASCWKAVAIDLNDVWRFESTVHCSVILNFAVFMCHNLSKVELLWK